MEPLEILQNIIKEHLRSRIKALEIPVDGRTIDMTQSQINSERIVKIRALIAKVTDATTIEELIEIVPELSFYVSQS